MMPGVESLNVIIVHNDHSELKSSSHHLEVESRHLPERYLMASENFECSSLFKVFILFGA